MMEWCVRVAILVAAEAVALVLVGVLSGRPGSPKEYSVIIAKLRNKLVCPNFCRNSNSHFV
jgi:hypothetical protein